MNGGARERAGQGWAAWARGRPAYQRSEPRRVRAWSAGSGAVVVGGLEAGGFEGEVEGGGKRQAAAHAVAPLARPGEPKAHVRRQNPGARERGDAVAHPRLQPHPAVPASGAGTLRRRKALPCRPPTAARHRRRPPQRPRTAPG